MITVNKKLAIRFKLDKTVFEQLNAAAYATQTRALGTNKKIVNTLLAHPSFCDNVLPILIGNNKQNSDWEREKFDYISSIQISIPTSGYDLNLNSSFDIDDIRLKPDIMKYVMANELFEVTDKVEGKVKTETTEAIEAVDATTKYASEEIIAQHILDNPQISILEYHKYFRFENWTDYLYWCVAEISNQVANNPEDVEKSPNIRFFIFDEKVVKRADMAKAKNTAKAINKLNSIKSTNGGNAVIKNIALNKHVLVFAEVEDMDDEEIYLSVFTFANNSPAEFLEAAENKTLSQEVLINKYLEKGIFVFDENNKIVDAANAANVIGVDITSAISYFNNPQNKGEIAKFEGKLKK